MTPPNDKTYGRAAVIVVLVLAAAGLFAGWKLFWFLTDDAYIAFRYASNSMAGHGYVWNPPPFKPVEGYTSFLWVTLLDMVWRTFGVPPPQSANWLSLVFTYLNLLLVSTILYRLSWPDRLKRPRPVFLLLFVVFLLGNRSFLAWASSGLETALFCLLVSMWVFCCLFVRSKWRAATIGGTASLLALTRPDGLLFVAASVIIIWVLSRQGGAGSTLRRFVLPLLPIGIVLIHLVWRFLTYGEWLPNTYYAKTVSMWPESGIRYAASFILEFGLWLWLGVVVVWGCVALFGSKLNRSPQKKNGKPPRYKAVLIVVVLTLLAHTAYYTLVIGGDHFEYRVYNHLIPFFFISFMAALFGLAAGRRSAMALAAALVLVSLPVQWSHWSLTHNLTNRDKTYVMVVPIAAHWPGVFRWYAGMFDGLQGWLIPQHVCMRHQEHKIFHEHMLREYPSRDEGSRITNDNYPVYLCTTVGVPGWVLPNVNILDKFGLNDYVIARSPVEKQQYRLMAHERRAPRDYIDGFAPNVEVEGGRAWVNPRDRKLTADTIIAHEAEWERIVRTGIQPETR